MLSDTLCRALSGGNGADGDSERAETPSGPHADRRPAPAPAEASSNSSGAQLQLQRRPAPTPAEASSSCRICLDPLSYADVRSGTAIRLRCRCAVDLIHSDCAEVWFRDVRCSSVCEVCRAECAGLPSEWQLKPISRQHTATATSPPVPGNPPLRLGRLLEFPSVMSFLAHYSFFCLLPAASLAIAAACFLVLVLRSGMITR
jgi:hypothetical protein